MLDGSTELLFELLAEEEDPSPRYRCEVVEGGEERARIRFLDPPPDIALGSCGRVYMPRERDHSFSCRAVRVWEVSSDGSECLVLFHGPAETTRARAFHRANVTDGTVVCTIGSESCRVTTISAGGLGVVATQALAIGSALEIALQDGAQSVSGRVRVASARPGSDGTVSYGFELAPGVGDTAPELATALARICVRLQLEDLRRHGSD